DMGYVKFDEPFKRLFTQGMIVKDGAKMSKSKGNVVSPDELIGEYGADTVRLYTLFIGPPEKDAEWSDRGVEGAYRFLGRVWRLVEGLGAKGHPENRGQSGPVSGLKRKTHQTIKKVTDDLEKGFHFNTAISAVMELVNEIYLSGQEHEEDAREAVRAVVILMSPFVPHIAEELWVKLGNKPGILAEPWPDYDREIVKEDIVTLPVQINGKLRSKIDVSPSAPEAEIKNAVMSDEKTVKWTEGKKIAKWIIIPGKLVNIVIR
ncbi:MAG: class I tRNA ligase family protein, partial [Candidatus Omnitrophota bacterium]